MPVTKKPYQCRTCGLEGTPDKFSKRCNRLCVECERAYHREYKKRPLSERNKPKALPRPVPEGFQTCNTCDLDLPLDRFYNRRKPYIGKQPKCRDCHNKRSNELKPHRALLKEQQRIAGRKNKLRKAYGISVESYEMLLHSQNGVCAICKQPETSIGKGGRPRHIAVDHDHEDSSIRGLLCTNCNNGLGRFKDSVELLQAAIDYLVDHKKLQFANPFHRSDIGASSAEEGVGDAAFAAPAGVSLDLLRSSTQN